MEEKIKNKNEKLLRKLIRKIGMSEKKFEDIWEECVKELGENKWSKAQIAQILASRWMNDKKDEMFGKSGFGNLDNF